jgi:hypothetical protein
MDSKNKNIRTLGVLIFSVGFLLGLALLAIVVWGDLEAHIFDPAIPSDEMLTTLRCPVMITAPEVGTVTATFTNPLDRPVEFRIRTHISEGHVTLMREENTSLPLEPGETQPLQWTVTADDAAFRRLILVRVRLFGKYPLPSRAGSCGILVVDLPYLSGSLIFALAFAASLLGMAGGAGLWVVANRPLSDQSLGVLRAMGALAGCVVVGTIIGLLGHWMLGGVVFVITLLLIGAVIGYFVIRLGKK